MNNTITLICVYPTKTTTDEIRALEITTDLGTRILLPGHAPLYAALKENSTMLITDATGTEKTIAIQRALLWVDRDHIRIIMNQQ